MPKIKTILEAISGLWTSDRRKSDKNRFSLRTQFDSVAGLWIVDESDEQPGIQFLEMGIYRQLGTPDPPLGWSSRDLLKQFGIESSVNVVLMGCIVISLECRDQSCYPRGKNNQIAGLGSRRIGVRRPRRHKDCGSGADAFGSVGIAEG
jgi:hypothetical protein